METATSQVIGQLSGYMRGLTQRLDPGTGWYGEFLRRDPEGMRACLDGAAMPPWDVLDSLLGDLAASTGAEAIARETQYAAGLRAAAVGVWDRLPGGAEELRTLLASAAEQMARARAALRVLSARLAESADPAEAEALSRELSWTRDDAARAAARHEDLTTRLEAVAPGAARPGRPSPVRPEPLSGMPAQRAATSPGAVPATARPGPREGTQPGSPDAAWPGAPADAQGATSGRAPGVTSEVTSDWASGAASDWASEVTSDRASGVASGAASGWASGASVDETSGRAPDAASAPASGPEPEAVAEAVGRAEGRWLRGARRSGGARYAGAAAPEARPVTMPPGQPSSATPLRGARFGRPARPAAEPAPAGDPAPEQDAPVAGPGRVGPARGVLHEPARASSDGRAHGQPPASAGQGGSPGFEPTGGFAASGPTGGSTGSGPSGGHSASGPTGGYTASGPTPGETWGPHAGRPGGGSGSTGQGGFVEGLVALRGQGRSGEAHALLCEAAAGPAERLVLLGEELARAGLAADWATLLWEAASLPPGRFAAAAAVLGPADRDALLRQGAARPAAEIAEIALVFGAAGHTPEADALLAAFVRVRTAEESARLARRDPRWFAPRLLRAAEALSGAHHRDLLHALRVANLPVA